MNGPRMAILSVCLVVGMLAVAPCHADRVYRLVDYPAFQNGHTLQGTITTTDDAPLDFVLDMSEIVRWQWSITGADIFIATSQDFLTDKSIASGVRITAEEIFLQFATFDNPFPGRVLELSREPASRNPFGGHRLSWSTIYTPSLGVTNIYDASRGFGDEIQSFWSDTVTINGGSTFLIATAVPEPSCLALFAVCAAAALSFCRVRGPIS